MQSPLREPRASLAPGSTLVRSTDIEMRPFPGSRPIVPIEDIKTSSSSRRRRSLGGRLDHLQPLPLHFFHFPQQLEIKKPSSSSLLKSASCHLQSPPPPQPPPPAMLCCCLVHFLSSVAFPPSAVARQSNVSKQQSGPAKKRPDLSLNPAVKSIYK